MEIITGLYDLLNVISIKSSAQHVVVDLLEMFAL